MNLIPRQPPSRNRHGVMTAVALLVIALVPGASFAATAEECLECHGEEGGAERASGDDSTGLFVDAEKYGDSSHRDFACTKCHADAVLVDYEHKPDLAEAKCSKCHVVQAKIFKTGLHGMALEHADALAPKCQDCHTAHAVFPPTDSRSSTYKFNIPATCSRCHQEGSEVAQTRKIAQHDIVKNYSMSIHGVGLFRRGLMVAAVCTDCHGTHRILPHEDPESSINKDKIAETCRECHGEIARVHKKVIKGETWERPNHEIPNCIDCHSPHEIRRVEYSGLFTDADCLKCHGPDVKNVAKNRDGKDLRVDQAKILDSAHGQLRCVKCHTGANTVDDPPCLHTGPVDCASCHAEMGQIYATSVHGKQLAGGNEVAPECKTCHGTHGVLPRKDSASPTHPRNVPGLCSKCHREGEKAAKLYKGDQHEIVKHYEMSVHGRGLIESGLLVTAICTSCHTAHGELPASDPASTVHSDNLPKTCGKCHAGVYEKFQESIHSARVSNSKERLPSCKDCHESHTIRRIDELGFRRATLDQCGECHKEVTESYFDTYHGKTSLLGSGNSAKCSDCHGSHNILPPTHLSSTLSRDNIVKTCAKCHPGSHQQFTGYLTHSTHKDKEKFPAVYYSFWAMTLLLLGTITFFGLHTLLWLPRSIREAWRKRKEGHKDEEWVLRFIPYHRITHVMVIISFFTLAITGMALKFSHTGWAQAIADVLGGFHSAGILHRLAAVVTFGYFTMHFIHLIKEKRAQGQGWIKFIFSKEGLFPNPRDLKEFIQTIRWFIGKGPRPDYGRWTYWEKFDYMAVFWGVAIIGMSGLILWFPEFFTRFLPGKAINVASIIHSDEALLAAGFIFTVHFFNTHFRPDKFPIDPVIFTGRMPLKEFKLERPREFRQLKESGELVDYIVEGPTKGWLRTIRVLGLVALALGISLIALIVYSLIYLQK